MSLYERWSLPRLTHLSMWQKQLAAYRTRALAGAYGRVLEIGIGSGLNLPFYGHGVKRVLGIDPSPELIRLAEKAAGNASFSVEFLIQSAEEMPLEKDSIDTAATTWTMCTIPDPVKALQEVRRVLKPDGLLIFVEHGRALEPKVVAEPADAVVEAVRRRLSSEAQDRRPRPTRRLQHRRAADGLRQGPRPMAFMYEGRARLS